MRTASVSYYRTAEEKPRLRIEEDQVLFLFFYEEGKAEGRYGSGLSRCATDDPATNCYSVRHNGLLWRVQSIEFVIGK